MNIDQHHPRRVCLWALLLSTYKYYIAVSEHTHTHANTDALGRLPLPILPEQVPTPPELVLLTERLADSPVTSDQIRGWTRRDPVFASVLQFVRQGWPSQCDPELGPFSSWKSELALHDGCIVWGAHVVIPPQGQQLVLQELPDGHLGMTK